MKKGLLAALILALLVQAGLCEAVTSGDVDVAVNEACVLALGEANAATEAAAMPEAADRTVMIASDAAEIVNLGDTLRIGVEGAKVSRWSCSRKSVASANTTRKRGCA